jgi:O-antigen ligase
MGIGITDAAFSTPRIFATFAHPNVFSLYLFFVLVTLTTYWTMYAETKQKQILCIVLGGITGILLLLTFSRFAWIATFVFFCLYSLWYKRIYLIPLIALPLLLTLLSSNIQERVLEAFNPLPDSSMVWREEFWHDNLQKTTQDDRQLLGYGMSTFPLVAAPLREYSTVPIDAHNDFIKFYVEGGYLGLVVYILFVSSILFILYQAYTRASSQQKPIFLLLLFAFACFLLASLSDNIWRATAVQWLFYILAGSALALSTNKKKTL